MPRNFDEVYSEDREFTIAGEAFHWRPVHWRTYGNWVDEAVRTEEANEAKRDAEVEKLVKKGMDKDEAMAKAETNGDSSLVGSLERVVDRITLYLVPDEVERFKQTANDVDKPVTILQLNEIAQWLTEVQAERPTNPPSPSGPGPGRTGATSPAG